MLFRLLDSDEQTDEFAQGPQGGPFDINWFGKYGYDQRPPEILGGGLMNGLTQQPEGPHDPLWDIAGLPRPPFRMAGPHFGLPYPVGALPPWSFDPILIARNATFGPSTSLGSDGYGPGEPSPAWFGNSYVPVPAQPPGVRGLMSLLEEDGDSSVTPPVQADRETTMDGGPATAALAGISGRALGPDQSNSDPNLVLAQAGGTSGASAPPRPSLNYSLDAMERNFRNTVSGWRKEGLNEAATNLERYLGGSGETRVIDRDEARQMGPIRSAEELNSWRTENAFTDPKWVHAEKLRKLGDGESITIRDHWDKEYGDWSFAKQLLGSDRDFALAFGNTKFHSEGNFDVTRIGDEIHIEGTVKHDWNDKYDFHSDRYFGFGGVGAKAAKALEQHRGAKPFATKSSWDRRIKGTIRIENGKLTAPVFEWEDVN